MVAEMLLSALAEAASTARCEDGGNAHVLPKAGVPSVFPLTVGRTLAMQTLASNLSILVGFLS